MAGCRSWRDARRSRAQGGAAWSRFARVLARPSVAAHPARRAGRRPRGVAPAHPPGARSRPRHRRRAAFHGMICCLRGDDGVDGGGKAGSPRAKAGKKSTSKADNAPGGAFGSPVPMSPTSDDEEFHDAEDTLPAIDPGSPKGASHRRTFSAALRDANAIALEEGHSEFGDISRCVIPRRDIPFEDPGSGAALSWSANPEGRGFRLRGKKYMSDRKKFPSASPLFSLARNADTVHILDSRAERAPYCSCMACTVHDAVILQEMWVECVHLAWRIR